MGKVREFEQHVTDKGNQSPVKEAVRFGEEIRISLDFQRGTRTGKKNGLGQGGMTNNSTPKINLPG